MYNCFDVAKKFVELAEKEGKPISPMKLLKLTYIAHGYYLAFSGNPLFLNEIEAWKYGPVIPDLYHIIKRFGKMPVNKDVINIYSENDLSKTDSRFIEIIWNSYKRFNGLQLSSKTHEDGTPWQKVYTGHYHKVIDNAIIEQYYKSIISEGKKSSA